MQHELMDSMRPWVILADAGLTALERTAWEIRRSVERVVDAASSDASELRDIGRRTKRLFIAAGTLGRIAGSYRLHRTRAAFSTKASAARALERLHQKNALRARALCEDLGGAMLKVGQLLSARPDLLPHAYVEQLAHLQDAAPTEPVESLRALIESDLEGTLDELFHSFDEKPIAAASIGQVHRARARVEGVPEGVDVAVKVKRPGIAERVSDDLLLLGHFLDSLAAELPPTDLDTIRAEIAEAVSSELDYVLERESMERHRDFFRDDPRVVVPTSLPSHCGEHVLTASFEESVKITDALDAAPSEERARLLGNLLDLYVRLVIDAGFFQADPHPGNLRVADDGAIVLLDFGCSQDVRPERRAAYLRVLRAAIVRDEAGMKQALVELGFRTQSGSPDTIALMADSLLQEVRQAFTGDEPKWRTKDELVAEAKRAMKLASDDPVVSVPGDFVMLARVFGTLGGLYLTHKPEGIASYLAPTLAHLLSAPVAA